MNAIYCGMDPCIIIIHMMSKHNLIMYINIPIFRHDKIGIQPPSLVYKDVYQSGISEYGFNYFFSL